MEYCILSKVDMEESGDILDESDLMVVEDFKRIMEFYNCEKKIRICDDEYMMDIFRFFIERDLMFEATLLAEKELASNVQEENDNTDAHERNKETEVIDRMVEDEIILQTQNRLSNAEMFYLECTLKSQRYME